jgi:hypothetical protein
VYQDKIHRYDYEIADRLVDALVKFYDGFPNLSPELQDDILDFMLEKVLGIATGANAKTITSLIPDNPRKLKKVQEAGGTFMYRYRDMIKSKKWFRQNGFCLDAIREGPSLIPNAGRGAFAARDIRMGETIAFSPMVHIADKETLTMYPIKEVRVHDEESDEEETVDVYDKSNGPIGKQILINYAFGHPDSSVVLLPAGPQVTLINHDKNANAQVLWANKKNDVIRNPREYLDYTAEMLSKVSDVAIVMKFVARRNIKEGEEITLDYGNEWEKAWDDYAEEWKLSKAGKPYPLKADDMKVKYKNKPFETVQTLTDDPYPDSVKIACFLNTAPRPDGTPMIHQEHGWDISTFDDPRSFEKFDGQELYKVTILDRKEAPGFFYNYTVRAEHGDEDKVFADVLDVPHAACTFVDDPYTSDIHIYGAFRHYIGIPDKIFPENWRNM